MVSSSSPYTYTMVVCKSARTRAATTKGMCLIRWAYTGRCDRLSVIAETVTTNAVGTIYNTKLRVRSWKDFQRELVLSLRRVRKPRLSNSEYDMRRLQGEPSNG